MSIQVLMGEEDYQGNDGQWKPLYESQALTDEELQWALDLAEKNHTYLH